MIERRIAAGFVMFAGLFVLFATGNIFAEIGFPQLRDPGPPPALEYRPLPPSCCGDSICLMEHHHD